jgi:D-serine deaminase-like pyridoxal phosphate-dependent protein
VKTEDQKLHLDLERCLAPALEDLPTPRLVVYRRRVEENIRRMRSYLEAVAPGSGLGHLRPHAKTHKCRWATELLAASGVSKHKCTPNELDMLLEAGARDVFVAYPLLLPQARRLAERVARFPEARIAAQVGGEEHARMLARAAREQGVEIDCYLDLDVGSGRTGMPPASAPELARAIRDAGLFEGLRLRGLHAYDGHNHSPDPGERAACAREAMAALVAGLRALERAGIPVERLIVAGSPGFEPCLEELVVRHGVEAEVDVSPGTWIFWDSGYERLMPAKFEMAALLLARVMDRPRGDLSTLDMGYKRWAIDQGPLELFSRRGLTVAKTSEEHTVIRHEPDDRPALGAPILAAPRHVCPTVNLWESFTLVGRDGAIEWPAVPIEARNR